MPTDLWVFFNSAFAATSVSKHQNILDHKFQILLSGPGLVKGMVVIYSEYSLKKINAYDELLMFVLMKALVILVNLPLAFLRYCCKIFLAINNLDFYQVCLSSSCRHGFLAPICRRPHSDFWQ